VDAGFALKCAVNSGWKNRAGLYHPARWSATDNTTFFGTLSALDVREGYSEMLKWAIAGDARLFAMLESHGERLCQEAFAGADEVTVACISRTIGGMMKELYDNPYEEVTTRRSYLGHALSPGLEPEVQHGRAVALEICIVAEISHARELISEATRNRIWATYTDVGMPLWDRVLAQPERLTLALADTTLHRGGQQAVTVPCGQVGEVTYLHDLTRDEIHRALERLHTAAHTH
jgi:3-dehydroquinate synthase